MKNIILTSIVLLSTQFSFSQQKQVTFQVSSGLFSFGGETATSTSSLNISDVSSISDYTNNPYGKNSGFSYGFGIQFQRLTSKNFIYGLQISYESLSSELTLTSAHGMIIPNVEVEDGKTILTNKFINLYPSIGQRVSLFNGIDSDVLFGCDFGFGLSSIEKYSATLGQGYEISGTNERENPKLDFRPRIEIINYYKSFGLSIGYSHGLTNYQSGYEGANLEAKSRYIRFGLNYRWR